MNRDPNVFELYKRIHKPKGKPDEFLTEQQRKIGKEYQWQGVESHSKSGEGSSQQSENNISLDVVGGSNQNGGIYRLGSQAHTIIASTSTVSSTPVDGVTPEEFAVMKAKIKTLQDELQETMQLKMEQWQQSVMEQWEQRFGSLLGNVLSSRSTPQQLAPPTNNDINGLESSSDDD